MQALRIFAWSIIIFPALILLVAIVLYSLAHDPHVVVPITVLILYSIVLKLTVFK